MRQINERTMIPLSWAAAMLTSLLAPAMVGAMWVKGVNDRLTRIESALHMTQEQASTSHNWLIQSAHADPKRPGK